MKKPPKPSQKERGENTTLPASSSTGGFACGLFANKKGFQTPVVGEYWEAGCWQTAKKKNIAALVPSRVATVLQKMFPHLPNQGVSVASLLNPIAMWIWFKILTGLMVEMTFLDKPAIGTLLGTPQPPQLGV